MTDLNIEVKRYFQLMQEVAQLEEQMGTVSAPTSSTVRSSKKITVICIRSTAQ